VSLNDLTASLRKIADPKTAEHSQRFFKTGKGEYGEGDRFLGIRVPVLRKYAKQYRDLKLTEIKKLIKSEYHEERLCALFLLVDKYQRGQEEEKSTIYNFFMKSTKFINNWDLVDISAPHIPGDYLEKKDKKPLYDFALSRDLWKRRIAIISTFHMIRKNSFDDALKISEILVKDKEDLIHKAVGWMLREIGNRDMNSEKGFLKKYYKKMPRTMLRYAIEKFPEVERKRYLKGEI
jgi:3-methyladenine DNA glycosylase AlkD